MTMACNYLYITDNLLDPSHVSWVHQSSFAARPAKTRRWKSSLPRTA